MSGNIIGTVSVMHQIWAQGREFVVQLDRNGIYGSDIWILYKYVCKTNIPTMLKVITSMNADSGKFVKDIITEIHGSRNPDAHIATLMANLHC